MAIRTVVTRGFGNGTFSGTIALVTLRGYVSFIFVANSRITTPAASNRTYTIGSSSRTFTPADD